MTIAAPAVKTCHRSPCVDAERCQACRECMPLELCPERAFERLPDSNRPVAVHLDGCYGCRACVTACPFEAVLWF
jgi:NAD-dependent dihydropyrimidine dehydrogenase PreA subunit